MQSLKNAPAIRRFRAAQAATALGLVTLAGAAKAELPAGIATAMTEVKADATALNDLVMPIVIAVIGMLIVYKLLKRFSNKI